MLNAAVDFLIFSAIENSVFVSVCRLLEMNRRTFYRRFGGVLGLLVIGSGGVCVQSDCCL